MKKRSLFTIIQWGGVIFLLALLTSCPGSSDIKIHTDGDLLKGQWAAYYDSSDDFYLIDIQHTLPGYWIAMHSEGENLENAAFPVKPNHTETEDGWFVVDSLFGTGSEMKYRFKDGERDILEAIVVFSDEDTMNLQLKRIPSDEEIELHIVTFKLDDSISPDDGYVFYAGDIHGVSSPLLIAVKHDASLDAYFPSLVQQDGTTYVDDAQFTADGTEFTKDTTVNSDITVIVKLQE